MNKTLRCVAVLMLVFASACVHEAPPEQAEEQVQSLEDNPATSKDDGAGALVDTCTRSNGQPCPAFGQTFRCMYAPFEPGLCFCTSALVWNCG